MSTLPSGRFETPSARIAWSSSMSCSFSFRAAQWWGSRVALFAVEPAIQLHAADRRAADLSIPTGQSAAVQRPVTPIRLCGAEEGDNTGTEAGREGEAP